MGTVLAHAVDRISGREYRLTPCLHIGSSVRKAVCIAVLVTYVQRQIPISMYLLFPRHPCIQIMPVAGKNLRRIADALLTERNRIGNIVRNIAESRSHRIVHLQKDMNILFRGLQNDSVSLLIFCGAYEAHIIFAAAHADCFSVFIQNLQCQYCHLNNLSFPSTYDIFSSYRLIYALTIVVNSFSP